MSKKLLAILFASILLLAACGGEETNTKNETNTTNDTETVSDNSTENNIEDNTENNGENNDENTTEENNDDETDNSIVLGEPIEVGDFTMTITEFSLGTDYDGNDALIITYDWENSSDESASPFITFDLKAFQDNVQTDDTFMVEGVDLESSQKEVKPEGKIEGAHDAVGINDMTQPLELELEELFSFDDDVYSITIDLSELE